MSRDVFGLIAPRSVIQSIFSNGCQTRIPFGAYSLLPNPGLIVAGFLLNERNLTVRRRGVKNHHIFDARLEPSTPRTTSERPNHSLTELPLSKSVLIFKASAYL